MTLTHPITGEVLPPTLSLQEAARILAKDEDTVAQDCRDGFIAAMPRRPGAPWQIITAKLLRQLGLLEEASA